MSAAPPTYARPWSTGAAATAPRRTSPVLRNAVLFLLLVPFALVLLSWSRTGALADGSARMPLTMPLFVVLAVVLGVVGVVVERRWQARRHERLASWGAVNGFAYEHHDRELLRLQRGAPFDEGDSHAVTEVLHRPWEDWHVASFTYRWSTGSGKNRQTHHAHVVALHLPAHLPRLEVTPEGVGARLAKLVGGQDMQLELEEFNREYRIVAADERVGHAVLHPRLMERLLADDVRGRPWRLEGRWLVTWDAGRTDVARLASRLGLLSAIARSVPRHVWQDHGHDPAGTISPLT